VAAGQAQMTSLGSFSEVVVANAADADLVAVAIEGQTSVEALLVENTANISRLTDLKGRKMGIKGGIPYSIRAMLAKAGVEESTLTQIEVDFNPVLLFETEIEALPVYKSNEPGQLDAQGYAGKYQTFDPAEQEVPSTFAVFTTSAAFAKEHPTAVADFLRATLKGFEWAEANPEEAVKASLAKSDPNLFFSPEGEAFRWKTELQLVRSSTPAGSAVGTIDPARLEAEVDNLVQLGVIPKDKASIEGAYDTSFMAQITDGDRLVWFE
jgi:NitT/TauT family transport system substrate-binding protein